MYMTARKNWLPQQKNSQIAWMQNFSVKIPGHRVALGLTAEQITEAQLLAMEFVAIMSEADQCQITMKAVNEWRDEVIWGPYANTTGKPAPLFLTIPAPTVNTGIYEQLSRFRDLCMAQPGFTTDIGEDVGFLGQQIAPRPPSEVTPDLRVSTAAGYTVTLTGSIQGCEAVKVQYARKGGDFADIGFLTNMPGSVTITPASPGNPESGHVRAVFVRKNENFGNFSPDYPVTIS